MFQIGFFDGTKPLKIKKPIRLIELFAGYGSQALALNYLNVHFESHHICEWAVKSIQAYKDIHFPQDTTDYSKEKSFEYVIDFLFEKKISADYNKPMERQQIKRMGEQRCRTCYNNIIATNNLGSITTFNGSDLEITDKDKYTYILTYSFPCQDLSKAGLGKGMEKDSGTRSGMLWEVERLLEDCNNTGTLPQILLMENVPDVIGTKNIKLFAKWLNRLENFGYHCYWKVLNSKDYGIPQTRDRCFMVSVLGDYFYEFPAKFTLEKRLKDFLEPVVEEKYYISKKGVDFLKSKIKKISQDNNDGVGIIKPAHGEFKGEFIKNVDIYPTIDTGIPKWHSLIAEPTIVQNPHGYNKGGEQDICPAITVSSWQENNFLKENEIKSEKLFDIPREIMKDNERQRRVYSAKGISPVILSRSDAPKIAEPLAFDEQNGYIRKDGLVGTLQTDGNSPKHNNRVIEPNLKEKLCNDLIKSGLLKENDVIRHNYTTAKNGDCVQGNNQAPTLDTRCDCLGIYDGCRIRKLTPRECFRLMGVKDKDYEKVAKNQSDTSLYHLAGDSIVVDVLMFIFKNLLGETK